MSEMKKITVRVVVDAPVEKVWKMWSSPEDIMKWNSASEDWHTPKAENDLRTGGRFLSRMEAKDGSMGFDFGGEYTEVVEHEIIAYVMDDQREVRVEFIETEDGKTEIIETFDAENENSAEMQRTGWQAILDNFKKYVEEN